MERINKGAGINPDMIGSISPNRRFALVYKGEIVAEGSHYDKAYQKNDGFEAGKLFLKSKIKQIRSSKIMH